MKKWIKEPLLHFVICGIAIFLVYDQLNQKTDSKHQIVIDDKHIQHIKSLWELQWKREPTFAEMKGLLDRYLRREIMYREALSLNLDEGDEIIKRRLSQKMEFMANDLTKIVVPASEDDLINYYENHKEKYKLPAKYSFKLLTFSRRYHEDPESYAKETLAQANTASNAALGVMGDQVLLPSEFDMASKSEIIRKIGKTFYEALDDQPLNIWAGPIPSGFGEHLVFISKRQNAHYPGFVNVRKDVQRDYEFELENNTKEALYREMKTKYTIVMKSALLDSYRDTENLASLNEAK